MKLKSNKNNNQSSACDIGIIDNHVGGKSIPKPVKKANLKKCTGQNSMRKPRSLRIKKLTISRMNANFQN